MPPKDSTRKIKLGTTQGKCLGMVIPTPTMKPILRILSTILALCCLSGATWSKPNIVFVLIDDMGFADLSCFGNTEVKTPHIDRLAAEGGRFSQFYVASPICSPSRCAIITGQYPQRWKITSFLNNRAENTRRGMAQWLDPQAPCLPRILQAHDYATGHFGKWHLGGQRDVDDAPAIKDYGFDATLTNFEGMGPKLLPLTQKPGDAEPGRIWADAERLGKPFTWVQRSQITGRFIQEAISFMQTAATAEKPFYVNVWPDDVHTPLWPPVDTWAEGKRGKFKAVLENMDRQLGVLFDHIRTHPKLKENTLIMLCSDNGNDPSVDSGAPRHRGSKGTLYEGGIRSPLIVWGPGLMPRDRIGFHDATSLLMATDVAPSLISLTGAKTPDSVKFDGQDMSAAFLGRSPAPARTRPVFYSRPPDRKRMPGSNEGPLPDLAVRDGQWKLLCDVDGSHPQLYQIAEDPMEQTNLAAKEPAAVQRLTAAVLAWHKSMPPNNSLSIP